ncbi:MAG: hypothetical protein GY795_10915 [Desulfobacterales bacterium]|nr:hypothetical protein [Desulfobacterales bacterium]
MNFDKQLERYAPREFRTFIEQNYYAHVELQARLEYFIKDKDFKKDPSQHVAIYSDHGIVHVRDVAEKIIELIPLTNGVLIPSRDINRLEFMKGYGVLLAYLHDIGMKDFSVAGRTMHPEFAAREVFKPLFDRFIHMVWDENWGNIAWHLHNLSVKGYLAQNPETVMREMLSMSMCHSKTKVPADVLNDQKKLGKALQKSVGTNLNHLFRQQAEGARERFDNAQNPNISPHKIEELKNAVKKTVPQSEKDSELFNHNLDKYYDNFQQDSFAWLITGHPKTESFICDVIDTIRVLRSADAMRQRGTTLKTSGGYEIFVDQTDANAIYALRSEGNKKLFVLASKNPISAGEANIASSEITPDGNMRVSFHRGSFSGKGALERAVCNAAMVIDDIQKDIAQSFHRMGKFKKDRSEKNYEDIQIVVEGVDDNLDFADKVCEELKNINPQIPNRIIPVPSLQNIDPREWNRYLNAEIIDWNTKKRKQILDEISGA